MTINKDDGDVIDQAMIKKAAQAQKELHYTQTHAIYEMISVMREEYKVKIETLEAQVSDLKYINGILMAKRSSE